MRRGGIVDGAKVGSGESSSGGAGETKKGDMDLLAMERDAKFNAWLQRKAILDSSYEYLKLLDSNRGKYREQTVDIAVSLLAVDKLLEHASKNVETTMTTVKAGLLEAKKGDLENVDGNVSAAGVRASVTTLPSAAPWRPGGLRQAPGRLPPPMATTSLTANAKKGELRVAVASAEGCMKGMWAVVGAGDDADLCKIAHSSSSSGAAISATASTTSLPGASAGPGTLELYSPGLESGHAAGAEVKVYASDSWKALSEALSPPGGTEGRDADGPGAKSMKSVWMKWAMEHHTLSDVVLTKVRPRGPAWKTRSLYIQAPQPQAPLAPPQGVPPRGGRPCWGYVTPFHTFHPMLPLPPSPLLPSYNCRTIWRVSARYAPAAASRAPHAARSQT